MEKFTKLIHLEIYHLLPVQLQDFKMESEIYPNSIDH